MISSSSYENLKVSFCFVLIILQDPENMLDVCDKMILFNKMKIDYTRDTGWKRCKNNKIITIISIGHFCVLIFI